MPDILLRVLQE